MKTLYTLAFFLVANFAFAQKDLKMVNQKRQAEDTVLARNQTPTSIPVIIKHVGTTPIPPEDTLLVGLIDPTQGFNFVGGSIIPIQHGTINPGDSINYNVIYTFSVSVPGLKRYFLATTLINNGVKDINLGNDFFGLTFDLQFRIGLKELNAYKNLKISKSILDANLIISNPDDLKGSINIYAVDGKLVHSESVINNVTQIDLSKFNKGIYLIQFNEKDKGAVLSSKIINN